MYVNENGKFTSAAEYFYNPHIDMYCIVDTTYAMGDLDDLRALFADPDLLTEVEMPDYITGADYDAPTW